MNYILLKRIFGCLHIYIIISESISDKHKMFSLITNNKGGLLLKL